MTKNLVGELIRSGKTTVQIQERVKDFPTNPTAEYLMNLGYTKSTAINYISKLKKNNLSDQEKEPKNISSKNKNTMRGSFICSKNADKNNLILDTCALQNRETIKIIDESTKVTVLLSTLNEMEEIKRKKNNLCSDEIFLRTMIGKYGKKFLKEAEKYRLVPFIGDDYNDNCILKYLMQQPISERQTLITADILFADRASCLGIEYILYDREEKDSNQTEKGELVQDVETENEVGSKVTKAEKDDLVQDAEIKKEAESKVTQAKKEKVLIEKNYGSQIKNEREEKDGKFYDFGVRITFQKEKISIRKFNYQAEVFFVRGEECLCNSGDEAEIDKDVDYIAVVNSSRYGYVKVVKEMVKNQKLEKEEYKYYNINEIYKSEGKLHNEILECCKNLLY